jgi:DNA transformation protein
MDEDRLPVGKLRNLGPKSARLLAEAGIRTIAELRLLGPAKAYARAKALKPKSVSLNLLWAIAAGLDDHDWRDLTQTEKDSLLAQIRRLR